MPENLLSLQDWLAFGTPVATEPPSPQSPQTPQISNFPTDSGVEPMSVSQWSQLGGTVVTPGLPEVRYGSEKDDYAKIKRSQVYLDPMGTARIRDPFIYPKGHDRRNRERQEPRPASSLSYGDPNLARWDSGAHWSTDRLYDPKKGWGDKPDDHDYRPQMENQKARTLAAMIGEEADAAKKIEGGWSKWNPFSVHGFGDSKDYFAAYYGYGKYKDKPEEAKRRVDAYRRYWFKRLPILGDIYEAGRTDNLTGWMAKWMPGVPEFARKGSLGRMQSGQGSLSDMRDLARLQGEARVPRTSWGDTATDIATQAPSFMTTFGMTGGAYTVGARGVANLGGKVAAKAVAKRAGKEAAKAAAKANPLLYSNAGFATGKWLKASIGGKTVSGLVGGVPMQTIANPQMVLKGVGESSLPKIRLTKNQERQWAEFLNNTKLKGGGSAYHGIVDTAIEIASERFGGLLSKIPAPRRLQLIGEAIKASVAGRYIRSFGPSKGLGYLRKAAQMGGWDGPLAEMLEERVGEIGRRAAGIREDMGATGDLLSGNWRKAIDQIMPEILGFVLIQGGIGVADASAANLEWLPSESDNPYEYAVEFPEIAASLPEKPTRGDFRRAGIHIGKKLGNTEQTRERFAAHARMAGQRVLELKEEEANTPPEGYEAGDLVTWISEGQEQAIGQSFDPQPISSVAKNDDGEWIATFDTPEGQVQIPVEELESIDDEMDEEIEEDVADDEVTEDGEVSTVDTPRVDQGGQVAPQEPTAPPVSTDIRPPTISGPTQTSAGTTLEKKGTQEQPQVIPQPTPHSEPLDRIVDANPGLAKLLDQDAGVKEKETVRQHTQRVLRNWRVERPALQGVAAELGMQESDFDMFMEDVIALHDIGKPLAIQAGKKSDQHRHTTPLLQKTLEDMGWGQAQVDLATELINNDFIGGLLKGKVTVQKAAQEIRDSAERLGIKPEVYMAMQQAFYKADAGAYPTLRDRLAGGKGPFGRTLAIKDINFNLLQEAIYGNPLEYSWFGPRGRSGEQARGDGTPRDGTGRRYQWAHGANTRFTSFNSELDSGRNLVGPGAYLVWNGDAEVASHYADRAMRRLLKLFKGKYQRKIVDASKEELDEVVAIVQRQRDYFASKGDQEVDVNGVMAVASTMLERYEDALETLHYIRDGHYGKNVMPVHFEPKKTLVLGGIDTGGQRATEKQFKELMELFPEANKHNPPRRMANLYEHIARYMEGGRAAVNNRLMEAGYDSIMFVHPKGGYTKPYKVMVALKHSDPSIAQEGDLLVAKEDYIPSESEVSGIPQSPEEIKDFEPAPTEVAQKSLGEQESQDQAQAEANEQGPQEEPPQEVSGWATIAEQLYEAIKRQAISGSLDAVAIKMRRSKVALFVQQAEAGNREAMEKLEQLHRIDVTGDTAEVDQAESEADPASIDAEAAGSVFDEEDLRRMRALQETNPAAFKKRLTAAAKKRYLEDNYHLRKMDSKTVVAAATNSSVPEAFARYTTLKEARKDLLSQADPTVIALYAKSKPAKAAEPLPEKVNNTLLQAREKARAASADARLFNLVARQAKSLKSEKGEATVERQRDNKDDTHSVTVAGDVIYRNLLVHPAVEWNAQEQQWLPARTARGNVKHWELTHIPTGLLVTGTQASRADMKKLAVLMAMAGVDWSTLESGDIPSDVSALAGQAIRAWEADSLHGLPEETQEGLRSMVGVTPTTVKADMVLDSVDLGETGGSKLRDDAASRLRQLGEAVPEFTYNPVFVVDADRQLVYRDGYVFTLAPEMFNLHPSELSPGMTVGINLEDLGIKRKTAQEVVIAQLKNAGLTKVAKNGPSAIRAYHGGGNVRVTGAAHEWDADNAVAREAIAKIRWSQSPREDKPDELAMEEDPWTSLDEPMSPPPLPEARPEVMHMEEASEESAQQENVLPEDNPGFERLVGHYEATGAAMAVGGPKIELEEPVGEEDFQPLSHHDIIAQMEADYDLPARRGRLPRSAMGIYKRKARVMRYNSKADADLGTKTHETAHHLDESTDILSSAPREAKKEMPDLDYDQRVTLTLKDGTTVAGVLSTRQPDADAISVRAGKPGSQENKSYKRSDIAEIDYKGRREFEGFAEFMRLYWTRPSEASARAPVMSQHLLDWMAKNPETGELIKRTQKHITRYRKSGFEKRVQDSIARHPGREPRPIDMSTFEWMKDKAGSGWRKFYKTFLNDRNYLDQQEKERRQRGGKKLEAGESLPEIAMATVGAAESSAREAIEDEVHSPWNNQRIGFTEEQYVRRLVNDHDISAEEGQAWLDSLVDEEAGEEAEDIHSITVDPVSLRGLNRLVTSVDYENFTLYLVAKQSIEMWSKGVTPPVTLEDARAFVNKYRSNEWDQAAQMVHRFHDAMTWAAAHAGLISVPEARRIVKSHSHYIPMYRDMTTVKRMRKQFGSSSLVNASGLFRRRTGSGARVLDPMVSTIMKAMQVYDRGNFNYLMLKMIEQGDDAGLRGPGRWFEEVKPDPSLTRFNLQKVWPDVRDQLEAAGISEEDLDGIPPESLAMQLNIWRPDYFKRNPGEPVHLVYTRTAAYQDKAQTPKLYWIDEEMSEAFRTTDMPFFREGIGKVMQAASNFVRTGATGLNPRFALNNALVDYIVYQFQREHGIPNHIKDALNTSEEDRTELQIEQLTNFMRGNRNMGLLKGALSYEGVLGTRSGQALYEGAAAAESVWTPLQSIWSYSAAMLRWLQGEKLPPTIAQFRGGGGEISQSMGQHRDIQLMIAQELRKGAPLSKPGLATGAVTGGVAGFAVAGPLGAFAGSVVGAAVGGRATKEHAEGFWHGIKTKPTETVVDLGSRTLEGIRGIVGFSEVGPRFAAFRQTAANLGWSEQRIQEEAAKGKRMPKHVQIAGINAAAESTLNYNRMGTLGRKLNRVIPYVNASIQGVDKMLRTFKDRPLATAMRIAPMLAFTVYWWLLRKDDDDYKERPEWLDNYYHFSDENGQMTYRFRVGHEWAVFKIGTEAILNWYNEKDPALMSEFEKQYMGSAAIPRAFRATGRAVTPPSRIAAINPMMEVWGNWSNFREAPIETAAMQKLPTERRYNERTTTPAKLLSQHIGKYVGISPVEIDHLLEGHTGGMYTRLDRAIEGKDQAGNLVFGGFMLRRNYTQSERDFYNRKATIEQQYNATKDDVKAKKLPRERLVDIERRYREMQDYQELMSGLRKSIRGVKDRDTRFVVEKYIAGVAREAMGKERLGLYPPPWRATDLPPAAQKAVDGFLGRAMMALTAPPPRRRAGESVQNYALRDDERKRRAFLAEGIIGRTGLTSEELAEAFQRHNSGRLSPDPLVTDRGLSGFGRRLLQIRQRQ